MTLVFQTCLYVRKNNANMFLGLELDKMFLKEVCDDIYAEWFNEQ